MAEKYNLCRKMLTVQKRDAENARKNKQVRGSETRAWEGDDISCSGQFRNMFERNTVMPLDANGSY